MKRGHKENIVKHIFLQICGFVLGTAILFAPFSVLATVYTPGETLNPDCAPTDINCSVIAPATSGANSDITSLSGLGFITSTNAYFTNLVFGNGTAATLTISATTTLNGGFFQNTLGNCSSEAQTLLYNATTGRFLCGVDGTTGTSTTNFTTPVTVNDGIHTSALYQDGLFIATSTADLSGLFYVDVNGNVSASGTVKVFGSTLLSDLAFVTANGTSITTTNAFFTTVGLSNILATNVTTTNLNATGQITLPTNSISDAFVVNGLTIDGGTINNTPIGATGASTGIFTNITSTNAFANNLAFGTADGTSITSTNGNIATLTGSSLTFTNLFGINVTSTNLSISGTTNLGQTTLTNGTSTNFFSSGLAFTTANGGSVTSTNGSFSRLATTGVTTTNLSFGIADGTSITSTNGFFTTLGVTNFAPSNMVSTNVTTTNLSVSGLTVLANTTISNVSTTNAFFSNLAFGVANGTSITSTNANFSGITFTNLFGSNVTTTNFSFTSASGTSSIVTNATSTNIFVNSLVFGSVQGTSLTIGATTTMQTSTIAGGFFQTGLTNCSLESQSLLYDSATGKFVCGIDGGGSASSTAGGADTQIQFNDGGAFNGSSALTFNTSTNLFSALNANLTGFTFGTASGTSITSTNASFTTLAVTTLNPANILATNVTTTNFNATGQITLPTNSISDAFVVNGLTIDGGTINNTPIGLITPSAGIFTDATSTNLFTTTFLASNGTIPNFNATNVTTTNLNATGQITLPNNSITDAMVIDTITASNYLLLTGGTLSGPLTGTSITTTNLFATTTTFLTSAIGSVTSTNLSFGVANGTSITSTNGFFSTLVASNFNPTNINASNVTTTNLNTSGLTFGTANGTSITTTNAFAGLFGVTNLSASNVTSTNLSISGTTNLGQTTLTNATSTNFNASGLSFTTANGTSITSTNLSFGVANGTSITSTNASFTNLSVTNFNPANINTTNVTSTNLSISGLTVLANTTISNVSTTNAFFSNLAFGVANGTSITSTNISAGLLVISATTTMQTSTIAGGFFQTGLGNCSLEAQSLLYDSSTGKFVCGVDATGGVGSFDGLLASPLFVTDGTTTSTLSANGLYIATSSANLSGLFAVNSLGSVSASGTLSIFGTSNFATTTASLVVIGGGTILPNSPLQIGGNTSSYLQVNVQNSSNGSRASSDYVATADDGTDSTFYINTGINGSGYSDPTFDITRSHDGYLYVHGGNLAIGTASSTNIIKFFTGGTVSTTERARITDNGISINTTTAGFALNVSGSSNFVGSLSFTSASGTSVTSTNFFSSNIAYNGLSGINSTSTNLFATSSVFINSTSTNVNISRSLRSATSTFFGAVSINTTSAGNFLTVMGSGPNTGLVRYQNTTSTGYTSFDLYDDVNILQFSFGHANTSTGGLANLNYINSNALNPIIFAMNNAEAIRIVSTLKVGFGTSSPQTLLSLAASTTRFGGLSFATDAFLYRSAASTIKTDGNFTVVGTASTTFLFTTSSLALNTTSTNIFATSTNFLNTTSTNISFTRLNGTSITTTNLSFGIAVGTSLTSTNISFTSLNGTNVTSTNFFSSGLSFTNLNGSNITSTNLNISGPTNLAGTTITNVTSTNFFSSGLSFTNLNGSNITSTNLNVSGLTVLATTTINGLNVSTTEVYFSDLTAPGATSDVVCFDVGGKLTHQAASCSVSSERFKHDINSWNGGLGTIMQLNPVSYKRNSDNVEELGLIAEQVDLVDKHFVVYEVNSTTPRSVDYARLVIPLISAIKEQQEQINGLTFAYAGISSTVPGATSEEELLFSANRPLASAMNYLLDKIANAAFIIKDFVAERITAMVGVFHKVKTESIEMNDSVTGETYCMRIVNGELVHTKGECTNTLDTPDTSGNDSNNETPPDNSENNVETISSSTPEDSGSSSTGTYEGGTNPPSDQGQIGDSPGGDTSSGDVEGSVGTSDGTTP